MIHSHWENLINEYWTIAPRENTEQVSYEPLVTKQLH